MMKIGIILRKVYYLFYYLMTAMVFSQSSVDCFLFYFILRLSYIQQTVTTTCFLLSVCGCGVCLFYKKIQLEIKTTQHTTETQYVKGSENTREW